jgi:glutathione S-transferase
MKLYFVPGVCSLSPHIALRESGLKFELDKVDRTTKKTASNGADYNLINPKSYVPALQLDDGTVLTEGIVIVQYIADLVPEKKLAPKYGTMERYRLNEWLAYIATEIHKGYGPLFRIKGAEERAPFVENLERRLGYIAHQLEGKAYLMGEQFTVADGYLYTVMTWSPRVGIDLAKWPALKAYFDRVAARPSVQAAHAAEKL